MHLLHNAEEAATLGADMVVLNCYVGMGDVAVESALLKKLASVSAECERIGMPLCGEIIPRVSYTDPGQTMPTSADMVVLNCYVGMGDVAVESALLKKLATVSAECERIGMPLCGEIIPRVSCADPAQTMPTSADLALAVRLGLEYGCDVVKTVYNGDPEGYANAVAAGHLPVIMAGGPKTPGEEAFFRQVHEAMTHGASGVAIGRRVWGSDQPAAVLKALRALVLEGASVEEAVKIRQGSRPGSAASGRACRC